MKTKKRILKELCAMERYAGQLGVVDKWHLNDENRENRERAIRDVTILETEIAVLKWVLDKIKI